MFTKTTIFLEHPVSKEVKEVSVGFSWEVSSFGFFYLWFKKDSHGAWLSLLSLVLLLSTIVLLFIFADLLDLDVDDGSIFVWLVSCLIGHNILFSFIYNKMFLKRLLLQGFLVKESPRFSIQELEIILEMRLPTVAKKSAKK